MEKQWIVYNALNDEHEFADTWEEVRDRVSAYAGKGCTIGKINVYQMIFMLEITQPTKDGE